MVSKLVLVALLLLPTAALGGETAGIRVQVDLGATMSVAVRAAVTDDNALVLGGAIVLAGEEHGGELTLDYGRALDSAGAGLRRLVEEHAGELPPDYGQALDSAGAGLRRLVEEHLVEAPTDRPPPPPSDGRPNWPLATDFLQGVATRPVGGGRVETWSGPLAFTLSFEEGAGMLESGWGALRDPAGFERAIAREWEQVGRFIAAQGLPARAGFRSGGTLHIFAVSGPTLQAPVRLRRAGLNPKASTRILQGFYEPLSNPEGDSSITVAPVEADRPHTVLGHELAHYAFDLFGLSGQWRGTSETFARAFELWAY